MYAARTVQHVLLVLRRLTCMLLRRDATACLLLDTTEELHCCHSHVSVIRC